MTLWLKLKGYLIAAGVFLAALAAAMLYGRAKGRQSEQGATRAAQEAAATAAATNQQLESRHETDAEVQRLPDAAAQPVETAAAGTAAGKLRDDGWLRD